MLFHRVTLAHQLQLLLQEPQHTMQHQPLPLQLLPYQLLHPPQAFLGSYL